MPKKTWKYDTWHGRLVRNVVSWIAVRMIRTGRRILKWSLKRCSWCGADPGFDSTISRKGLRCQTLTRNCVDMP